MPSQACLTPAQLDQLLKLVASCASPDVVAKAIGVPLHAALALASHDPDDRFRLAAAVEEGARRDDAAAMRLLDECLTTAGPERSIMRAKSQSLRCRARDARKLSVQLHKARHTDERPAVMPRSAALVRELRKSATATTTPTPTSDTLMGRMVHRHLAKLNAQAALKSAPPATIEPPAPTKPAPVSAPPYTGSNSLQHPTVAEIDVMGRTAFVAFCNGVRGDADVWNALPKEVRVAIRQRAVVLGLVKQPTQPVTTA